MAGARTEEETLTLIKVRVKNGELFTGRRHTAKNAWEEVLKALGLFGSVTPTQIGKKWDNLKRKYKELKCPSTGTGTDRPQQPHGHILRPCMDSATAAVASGSGSTSTKALQSQATVEDEEAAKSGSDSQEDVEPSTSAAPRKKRKRSLLQFLEAAKEEDRFNRQ